MSNYRVTCISVIVAAHFTVAELWKWPSVHHQMNGVNRVFTCNGLLLHHGGKLRSFIGKWMNLETIW